MYGPKNLCTFVMEYYENMIRDITEIIHHRGVVERIDGEKCYVRILQHSACAGCAAHKLCNSSESKEKIIEVLQKKDMLQVGDVVDVEGTVTQGLRAVYICYLIPLLILILFLFIGERMGGDLVGIALSLLFLAIYYMSLYLNRSRIGQHFVFSVRKV